jgi:hypothetical protein
MRRAIRCGVLAALTAVLGLPAWAEVIAWSRVENHSFQEADQLRAWTVVPHHPPNTIQWAPAGFDAGSGSVAITENHNGGAEIQQCLTGVVPGWGYTFQARWFAAPGQPVPSGRGNIYRFLSFNAKDDCSGSILGVSHLFTSFGTAGSAGWQLTQITGGAPAGARSARVILGVSNLEPSPTGPITAQFDAISFFGPYRFVKGSLLNRGETDLLLRHAPTNEHRVWFLDNERLVGQGAISPTPPAGWQAVGVDDFDGDGRNDLLMWHPVNGWLDFWLLNGINRMGAPVAIGGGDPGPSWKPSATADFNHDGRPDIVLRDPVSQQIRIWTMNGTSHVGTITPNPPQAVDANWEVVGAADLDGDGHTNFLWYNTASGRIVYWLMDANVVRRAGNFTQPASAGNANWKVVAMGDFGIGSNGQPATQDIVWRNVDSGRTVVWFMDRSGALNRTWGAYAGPEPPPQPVADWTVVGPR